MFFLSSYAWEGLSDSQEKWLSRAPNSDFSHKQNFCQGQSSQNVGSLFARKVGGGFNTWCFVLGMREGPGPHKHNLYQGLAAWTPPSISFIKKISSSIEPLLAECKLPKVHNSGVSTGQAQISVSVQ
jgi:hypothetical protein